MIESEVQQAVFTVTGQLQKADGTTMLREALRLLKEILPEKRVQAFDVFRQQIEKNATNGWFSSGPIRLSDGRTLFIGGNPKNSLIFNAAGNFQKITLNTQQALNATAKKTITID
ncbi:hypothetical protein [Nostoc sp. PA-18-2419]|uniref:hypothetical protein n=1 Tax=Nostoc sp. PA-18-2419 TaxID=2575443 RepID=UPI001108A2FF|nr:hypothetical protein [Nostoc sp. PA-18-2419]